MSQSGATWPHGSCSFLIDSEKPGDIRRSESRHGTQECVRHVGDQPGPTWLMQFPHRFGKSPVTSGGLNPHPGRRTEVQERVELLFHAYWTPTRAGGKL